MPALALLLTVFALASSGAAAQAPRASLPDIEDEVMCVECGTALNISESAVADRTRDFIRRRIEQGQTKEQIKDALVAEFGPGVLALPDDDGFNVAVYVVPPLLALLALTAVALTAARWRRLGRLGATPQAPEPEPLDPDAERRLERDLARYDV